MNLYKIIILSVICISISISQFKEVSINIDYSNINEKLRISQKTGDEYFYQS